MLAIETVAVLGSGEAAHACALLLALGGATVRFHVPAPPSLDEAARALHEALEAALERGQLSRADRQRALDGILFTTDLEEAVTAADLVLAQESPPAHGCAALARLGPLVRATTPLAAPDVATAAAVAAAVPQPGRALALLVDRAGGATRLRAVAAPATAPHVLGAVAAFAARLGERGGGRP